MSNKNGKVMLAAWIEPELRDAARVRAFEDDWTFSAWVANAITNALAVDTGDSKITSEVDSE